MKHFIIILGCLCLTISVLAQQDLYQWRVGLHGGYFIYSGDLNSSVSAFDVSNPINDLDDYQNASDLISYGLSIERRMSKGWSLKLLGTNGVFRANDRTINYWNGNILPNPDFTRSLNVETKIWDASLMATYHFDDGKVLSRTSWIAPYISFGVGFNHFETAGDLFDSNGNRYHYWSDNTIRNQPEGTLIATIIEQDANFETDLDALRTEGTDYNQDVWNIPVAFGLKFRLSDQINFNIEALIRYVDSDYLDDVSGDFPTNFDNGLQAYASNPNNLTKTKRGDDSSNDYYGFVSLSLHYNFGRTSEDFIPPVFYTRDATAPTIEGNQIDENESTAKASVEKDITVNETGTEITVTEKIIDPNGIVVKITEEVITIDSTQKVDEVLEKLEKRDDVKVIEGKEDIEIIKETEIVPTLKTKTVKTIEPNETTVEIPTEKIEKIEAPVIKTKEEVVKIDAPSALEGKTAQVDYTQEELQLIDLQETRLKIAQLTESVNDITISNKAVTEKNIEIIAIKTRMDSLESKVASFEQYNNSVAIRGNNDYSKPENEEIRTSTGELNAEVEELKRKLAIANSNEVDSVGLQQKKIERIQQDKAKQAEKIAKLEKRLSKLKSKNKRLKSDKSNVWNPSRLDKNKPKTETVIITKPVETEATKKVEEVADKVIEQPIPSTAPTVVKNYDNDIQRLNEEVKALKNQQKSQVIINTLRGKVATLEAKLKAIQESNSQYVNLLQNKINALNEKVKLLEERKTVVEVPVERVITTTPNVTKVLGESYRKTNVFFDNGSTTIKSEFYIALDRLAQLMVENPNIVATLTGSADKSGNAEANFQLSKKRATAVKNYLTRKGISSSRINITYLGAEKARAANDPYSRRVEVELIIQ